MKAWTATWVLGLALLLQACGVSGDSGKSDKTGDLAIQNVEVTTVTDSSATVEWNTNLDAVTTLEYGATSTNLNLNKSSALGQTHSANLDNLQEDTDYHFQIVASDGLDTSIRTDVSSFRTELSEDHNDTTAPVISDIQVIGITPASATITWTTDDRTTGRVSYGPGRFLSVETPADVFQRSHSVVLPSLNADIKYDFMVHALNRAELSSFSEELSFKTEANPSLYIWPEEINASVGEIFEFEVRVANAKNLAGVQFMVNYSATNMDVFDFHPGEFHDDGGHLYLVNNGQSWFPIDIDFTWGIVFDSEGNAVGSEAKESGVLAVFKARAIGTTSGSEIKFQLLPVGSGPGSTYDYQNSGNATRLLDHHRNALLVDVDSATLVIS